MFYTAQDTSVHRAWQNYAVFRPNFCNDYNEVRRDNMIDINQDWYWIDDPGGTPFSFASFVPISFDKISPSLKSTAHVAYVVGAFVINCSLPYRR